MRNWKVGNRCKFGLGAAPVALFVPNNVTHISHNQVYITLNDYTLREYIFQNTIENKRNCGLRLYKRYKQSKLKT